jgi:hypothetical protein
LSFLVLLIQAGGGFASIGAPDLRHRLFWLGLFCLGVSEVMPRGRGVTSGHSPTFADPSTPLRGFEDPIGS